MASAQKKTRPGCPAAEMIDAADLGLIFETDSVDAAFDFITAQLTEHALAEPGGKL